jgi:endonuclease G, mitochondrial
VSTRAGFDRNHLPGIVVELPTPATPAISSDIQPTTSGAPVRDCTHFSLSLSTSRRLCRWVGWNIDGASKVTTTSDHREFVFDPAYPEGDQTGSALYTDDALDQGHIAAFSDVSWGTVDEAAQARRESCYFSNITPQLADFNRSSEKGLWGQLENEIAKENKVAQQRLSLVGGPILHDDDLQYRGVRVPSEFFKLVAYVEDGALKAKGFRLTQKDLEGELALLPLNQFRVYQQAIAEIAGEVGLDFGALTEADTAPAPASGVEGSLALRPRVRRIEKLNEAVAPGW